MPRASVILILLLLLLTVTVSYAQDVTRTFAINPDSLTPAKLRSARFQNVKGYRLGIALSGGGARGLAQIGVLDELTRAGIDIDLVAGTSMGGIIGGLYALGMSPAEIEATTEGIDWSSLFSDKPGRRSLLFSRRAETEGELLTLRFDGFNPRIPTALSSGQKLFNVLNSLTQVPAYFSKGDFANLDRKLAIVSTDIVTGEKVVFTSGSLVMAMRATTGVPLAFTPLEDGDRLLMDGGLLDPIPTDEVRKLGADFVIAVNTTSSLLPKEEITNPVDIANQTTTILQATTQRRLLEQADLVITPNLTGIKATDFSKIPDVIEAGRLAARSLIDSLRQLLAERNSTSFNLSVNSIMVACVDGDQPLSPSHRKAVADLQALSGQILGQTDIDRAVYRLFKSGFWSKIGYQLQPSNTGRKLLVSVTPFPTIKSIRICGNQVFADSTLLRVSGADTADIHSLARLVDIYDRILDHYHCYGYDLAQIKNASLGEKNHILTLELDEGKIVGISVEGDEKTRWWVVTSYFPLKTGQLYSKFKAAAGVRNIHASGLFENVSLQLSEGEDGVWIKIIVKERDFTYVKLGGRYHEEFHPEAFLKVGYANIGGTGNELSLYSRFSERRKVFQAQMRADRIFRTMATYNIRVYYRNDKVGVFTGEKRIGHRTDKRWGARVAVGQQLARFGLLDVTARYENISYSLPGEELKTRHRVASLQFNLRYDTKDRCTFPTSGGASAFFFEIASDLLGADEVFKKMEGYVENYQNLMGKICFHPRIAIGISQVGLPIYCRFYLGGTRSFIGYRPDQLTGDKYFVTNLELRLGPIYHFYLSGRYDMGEVFNYFEQLRFKWLRHTFGFTLALDTPLGPFSFSYGRAENKYDNLYLNIGYDF